MWLPLLSTEAKGQEASFSRATITSQKKSDPKDESLKNSVDSLQNSVKALQEEVTTLRGSVYKSAEDFVEKQNALLGDLNIVFLGLGIVVAIAGIAIPLFQSRRLKVLENLTSLQEQRSKKAESDYNLLKEQMSQNLAETKRRRVDRAFENLKGPQGSLREEAFDYLSRYVYPGDLEEYQLLSVKSILRETQLPERWREKLASFLLDNGRNPHSDDFFSSIVLYPELLAIRTVRYYAYKYLSMSNLGQKVRHISTLILASSNPTEEYMQAIDWISSDSKPFLIDLAESRALNQDSRINTKRIIEKLRGTFANDPLNDRLNNTFLLNLPQKSD